MGSIVGQLLHLTAAERRTLLVAGAAGGMTAVFATPVAAVLLAVELLLFEWRPRSMIPVALAACAAEAVREVLAHHGLLRAAPLFATTQHGQLGAAVSGGAILIGVACGGLAWVMTRCVYGAEDLFGRLPLHWSWWPALGGIVVGVGGLIDPRALGVGYDTIGAELAGRLALDTLLVLLIVKLVIWSVALGSNTSGGILAPLLMLGAALGGLLGAVLPGAGEGTWALLGMAAALAGVTRSPFTSIVFALELTHDVNALLALLIACTIAHLVSVLTLKRSILTEKVARRGYHVTREYEIDPLHALLVRDVMDSDVLTVEPSLGVAELYRRLPEGSHERRQRLYPVLDPTRRSSACWPSPTCSPRTSPPVRARPARWLATPRSPSPTRRCARSPTGWSPRGTACCPWSIARILRASKGLSASSTCSAPTSACLSRSATASVRCARGASRRALARCSHSASPRATLSERSLLDEDYRRLLAFRSELRRFLSWSEQTAREAGPDVLAASAAARPARSPRGARADDRTRSPRSCTYVTTAPSSWSSGARPLGSCAGSATPSTTAAFTSVSRSTDASNWRCSRASTSSASRHSPRPSSVSCIPE